LNGGTPGVTLSSKANASVEGILKGAGTGSGFTTTSSDWGNYQFTLNAGGNAILRGDNRASASNTNAALTGGGVVVNAGVTALGGNLATGNVSIIGETNNAASNAINIQPALVASGSGGLGYSSFSANGGNLLFQSNQGGIFFANNSTAPNSQGTIAGSGMSAKNITFDNTGAGMTVNGVVGAGSIDSVTGAVTVRGTGAASGVIGVNLNEKTYINTQVTPNITYTESYQATGNINISGASSDSNSTAINVATNLNAGGNVIIQSKGGQITLSAGSVTGSGSSAAYSGGIVAGSNMTVDNRGSTIAADGTVTLAGNADSGTGQGVLISNAGVSATGALGVYGGSGSSVGLSSSGLMQGGTLTLLGATSSVVAALALSGSNTRITGSGASTLTGINSSTGGGVYLGGTETLTVGTGATLTEMGLISNGGTLVFNGAGTLVVSGNIVNTGALNQSGTGKTILTGTNTYRGATTINAGTLQIGNGGANGNLGTGAVTNNANLVFNTSGSSNVGSQISGSGGLTQMGSGTTILTGNNTYTGTTTVSAGTLQVGNGGASGSLGSGGAVVLSNNANLSYMSNTTVNINNDISGAGNVSANANGTMSNLNLNSNINLSAGNLTLNATGAISQSPNMLLNGPNLVMTAHGGGIGLAGQRINSNVNAISLSATDNIFVTNTNAVTVAAQTTANNGSIDVKTLDGTMAVGSVNGINGITTNGSGNITLNATSSSGDGLHVNAPITANAGNISLTGSTSGSLGSSNVVSGVYVHGTISGNSIYINGSATNPSADGLGYYGGFDKLNATTTISLNGTTNGIYGTGVYSFDGKYNSGAGMSITGNGGVGFSDMSTLTNGNAGGIRIVGTTDRSGGISLEGVSIINGGGDVILQVLKGDLGIYPGDIQNWGGNIRSNSITNSGSGSINISLGSGNLTDSGSLTFGSYNSQNAIFNIVQNGNGGVQIQSSAAGNITVPTITNRGTGNVSIAAGANLSPDSTGGGGQVLTLSGNTITQASTGKTYIYTGSLSGTGDLSYLDPTNFSTLFYEGAANSLNTAFGQTVGNVISGGANSQVLFRQMQQTSLFNASLTPVNLTKVYDASVLSNTEFKDALLAANTGNITQRVGNNTLGLAKADVIDHLYLDATSAMYKNVLRDSSTQSVNAYTLGTVNNNADTIINFSGDNTLTVTPTTLTVNGLTASNKVYDTTTAASLNGIASVSALGTDQVALSGAATGNFADKNVGNKKSVTISGLNLTGADAGNYTLVQSPANANITPATLTINGLTASNKVYDATTAASLNGTASVSALGTDQVAINGTAVGSFANKNVGNSKSVTISGLNLTGTDAGNYTLVQSPANANITPATLTINGLTASNKIYDTTTAASLNGIASVSALGTDQVALSGAATGNFGDKNVGNTKSVTISGMSLTGADASNYTLAQAPTNANITPATLTINGLTASNKVYDATTAASLSGTASVSALGTDQVALSGAATGNFADKNVGNKKSVTISGLNLTGADAGNYTLVQSPANANITPATLTINGLTASNKVYDATTAASLNGIASVSALGADQVAINGTAMGNFADKNVGNSKSVTISGLNLTGTDAGNYALINGVVTANIAPAILTVNASTNTKNYDGMNTAAALPTVSGLKGVDSINGVSESYTNVNPGLNKVINVNDGYTINDGNNGKNYIAQLKI